MSDLVKRLRNQSGAIFSEAADRIAEQQRIIDGFMANSSRKDERIAEVDSARKCLIYDNEKLQAKLDEYEENTEILLDRLDEFSRLLKVAKCPDDNCDGNGTVLLGEYQHDNGEIEQHLEQCQWCCERDAALNGEADE